MSKERYFDLRVSVHQQTKRYDAASIIISNKVDDMLHFYLRITLLVNESEVYFVTNSFNIVTVTDW